MIGGTGQKLTAAATAVGGVAALAATGLSVVSIWLQTKNYRKPLLQRFVVRILLMVPIYAISSWVSMISLSAAAYFDPIRDVYEAFTIYSFFQLLINYLGGERALIIMTHGREPVSHLWPLNRVLSRVDISDPYTFLAVKRGILQYVWLKLILSVATIIMRATDTYQEGHIQLSSGYFWSGLIYNVSVTVCLYALGLFGVCMHMDLRPFRPMPKFLCIKGLIFASYWQGFFLAVLVWLGALPDDVQGYTPDNLAASIQDFLICLEMPAFAMAHWYAFSWQDFADDRISSARMPVWYAIRDAFGIRDLIEDSKETLRGDKYAYRIFDSGDKIMAHESSRSRLARLKAGMRYERGGKGKYWIPQPDEINSTTPLLGAPNGSSSRRCDLSSTYHDGLEELVLDPEEEAMYDAARALEFGDWNCPVITVNDARRGRSFSPHPNLYQPTPTGITYHQSSSDSVPSPDPSDPFDRQRKLVSEGAQVRSKGRKGKKERASKTKWPVTKDVDPSRRDYSVKHSLEIDCGPFVGTNPQLTKDGFEIDPEDTLHHSQDRGKSLKALGGESRHNFGPINEESAQWNRRSDAGQTAGLHDGLKGSDGFRDDAWGK